MDIFKSLGITLGQPTLSDSLDNLWKAGTGEGSRGGKITGHTTSGKPIYGNVDVKRDGNYTRADHEDALKHFKDAHDKKLGSQSTSPVWKDDAGDHEAQALRKMGGHHQDQLRKPLHELQTRAWHHANARGV